MTYEEYKERQKSLETQFEDMRLELMKEFVRANNPHKVGDQVTDGIGTIIIESIGFAWNWRSIPCAIYYGPELKKDGTSRKDKSKRKVWQCNLIKS